MESCARPGACAYVDRSGGLAKAPWLLTGHVDGKKTGFRSFDVESSKELAEHYPTVAKLKVERPVVFALGYGDALEGAAVFYSASVLVAKFGGIAFEPQGGVFMKGEDLLNAAKECQAMAAGEAE